MVALETWFEWGAGPTTVHTPEELDTLLDQVADTKGPVMAQLLIADDPVKAILNVGIDDDKGVLYYTGDESPDGCFSRSDKSIDRELLYYYMMNDTEFPRDAEVPVEAVRKAAHEYMVTGGERPTTVNWQPST